MTPSERIISLIQHYEGLRLTAYQDAIKVWTIGYGTTRYPNGNKVAEGDKITEREALEYLHDEINKKAAAILFLIKDVPINQDQFDAFVSFAYNVGIYAFEKSTLLKKFKNNPHDPSIYKYTIDEDGNAIVDSCEFLRWTRGNGKVLPGLVKRRKAEADFYSGNFSNNET